MRESWNCRFKLSLIKAANSIPIIERISTTSGVIANRFPNAMPQPRSPPDAPKQETSVVNFKR